LKTLQNTIQLYNSGS